MKTILALNPTKRKKRKKTKRAGKTKTAPSRKAAPKMAKKKVTKKRRRPRKNPSSRKRSVATRARGLLSGLRPQAAAVGALKQTGGMLLTQFFAKKFAAGGGANENWSRNNYLMGTAGAFAAGIAAEMVKKGSGHEFLKGGLSLLAYKIFTNEIAPQNEFLMTNFGEDDDEIIDFGADEYDDDEIDYLLGEDGDEFYMNDDGVFDELGYDDDEVDVLLGESLVSPGALGDDLIDDDNELLLGDPLAPVGPLGGDPFAKVFGGDRDLDVAMYTASQA